MIEMIKSFVFIAKDPWLPCWFTCASSAREQVSQKRVVYNIALESIFLFFFLRSFFFCISCRFIIFAHYRRYLTLSSRDILFFSKHLIVLFLSVQYYVGLFCLSVFRLILNFLIVLVRKFRNFLDILLIKKKYFLLENICSNEIEFWKTSHVRCNEYAFYRV